MRLFALLTVAAALASCGEEPLALPADPIDRAATCGVVAAATARAASADIEAPLTFAEQQHIIHYALLAGAEGESFLQDRAAAVAERMPALEAGITGGRWQTLAEPCRSAYPAAAGTDDVALPADPLEAQHGCFMLADFLTAALGSQQVNYGAALRDYENLQLALDARIGRTIAARGGMSFDEIQAARGRAMATVVRLGPPDAVMAACVDRFD